MAAVERVMSRVAVEIGALIFAVLLFLFFFSFHVPRCGVRDRSISCNWSTQSATRKISSCVSGARQFTLEHLGDPVYPCATFFPACHTSSPPLHGTTQVVDCTYSPFPLSIYDLSYPSASPKSPLPSTGTAETVTKKHSYLFDVWFLPTQNQGTRSSAQDSEPSEREKSSRST